MKSQKNTLETGVETFKSSHSSHVVLLLSSNDHTETYFSLHKDFVSFRNINTYSYFEHLEI